MATIYANNRHSLHLPAGKLLTITGADSTAAAVYREIEGDDYGTVSGTTAETVGPFFEPRSYWIEVTASSVSTSIGAPEARVQDKQQDVLKNALTGDLIMRVITADQSRVEGTGPFTYTVQFELVDSNGTRHDWFSGDASATAGDTSALGTASVNDATPAMVDGVGTVTLTLSAHAWVAAEVATVEFGGTINGYTVTTDTFTVTIISA